MTKLQTTNSIADEAESEDPVVPADALENADSGDPDHYDVSVQCDLGGDPDRVHVTSISPRVRK